MSVKVEKVKKSENEEFLSQSNALPWVAGWVLDAVTKWKVTFLETNWTIKPSFRNELLFSNHPQIKAVKLIIMLSVIHSFYGYL